MTESGFVGLDELVTNAEPLESADYVDYELIPVGLYVSQQRTIKAKEKTDGTVTFEISFSNGLDNPDNGTKVGNGTYPLRHWVSTKKFSLPNRPGQTSSAAQYLRAVGIDPKGVESVKEAMEVSQTLPVKVFIGRTNRTEKLADGTYEKETLKTADFNIGTKDAPEYVPSVTIGGKTILGRHKIQGFRAIS